MATYQITLDDEVLEQKIGDILNDALNRQINRTASSTNELIAAACKELVYSHKDEIIDKVVERAAREIARKGLVKLLERGESDG